MKRVTTHFLRLVLLIIALAVLAFCIFALPAMWRGGSAEFPMASQAVFLIMIGLYATAVPFYIALYHLFKLLRYIDHNKAFSALSLQALKNIKYCTIIIAALYVGGIPLLYPIADADDAPGLILIGMAVACIPVAIAVFTIVLHRLLQQALDIQSENDLTV